MFMYRADYLIIIYFVLFFIFPFYSNDFLLLVSLQTDLSVPIIPQEQPPAPYPAQSFPTLTTSPGPRTTPACCASIRMSAKKPVASLSSMTPFTRKRRALTSASACPWGARWAPTSRLPKSPFWQTAMTVSGSV